jgi:hypothetical protein
MSSRQQGAPARAGACRWWCLLAAAAVLVAGCSFASGMLKTLSALRDAGIHNPDITGGSDQVTLTYDSGADLTGLRAEQDRAAEVMWKNFPLRFAELTVAPRSSGAPGTVQRVYPRAELEARFGPRPAGLDKTSGDVGQAARDTARNVVIGLAVGGVVLLALVVLVIVLVVRASRRRPAAPAPPTGAGWGQRPPGAQPGWGQPPWPQQPQPPWPQPPPPPGWPQQQTPTQQWPGQSEAPGAPGPPSGDLPTGELPAGEPPSGEPPRDRRVTPPE